MGNRFEAPRIPNRLTRRTFLAGITSPILVPILAACAPQQPDQNTISTAIAQGVAAARATLTPNSEAVLATAVAVPTEPAPSPSPIPKPTAEPTGTIQIVRTPTPTELTNGWVHLRSNSPGITYDLDHPNNFNEDKYGNPGSMVDLLSGEQIKGTPTRIHIYGYSLGTTIPSAEQFAKTVVDQEIKLYSNFKDPEKQFGLKPFRFRQIDDQDAWAIDSTITKADMSNIPFDSRRIETIFVDKGYGWTINFVAHPDAFNSTLPMFHKILDSFKVIR